ncbi:hypothetical protein EYF80_067835 [Liparis tanakae]|uniref:Uncharacterized protein n=1 Tax=Liparis tanakae TaxID=230148 RepID=A0A4Z2E0Y7_9TELE|nr:hypothetical protein EYF80_067835 [Liparis tanakae]
MTIKSESRVKGRGRKSHESDGPLTSDLKVRLNFKGDSGRFMGVSPKAPGSVHWQRPHTQRPRPPHIWPSAATQAAVSVGQLQSSPT